MCDTEDMGDNDKTIWAEPEIEELEIKRKEETQEMPLRRETMQTNQRWRGDRSRQKTDFYGQNVMNTNINSPI